ncbi:MAG: Arc family DNA binding domain-containing protein [Bacteroidales bacterium]|nr:Arc family DNA binding domain-containing protein [Bacteroidales bacterium]
MQKKPFVLRINPQIMNALEKWAADEFRSVNGQIEWILNRALREAGRLREEERQEEHDKEK